MWDKVFIAVLVWGITVYKFGAMWRDGQWRSGSVTFYFWSFSLFTAIGVTLLIWPVYLAFDHFWGLTNLAWLIKYMAFCLAIYYMASGCYLAIKQNKPPLMTWSLLLTLAILISVYVWGISTLPEKPDHTIPETWVEVLFMQTMYVYMAILCAIPFTTFVRLYRHEEVVSTRLRWFVGVAASVAATTVLLLKIILTLLAFQNPATAALNILQPLITIGFVSAGLLCVLAFLPNRAYRVITCPYEFLDKTMALHDLRALQKRLNALCPPVIDDRPNFLASTKNPDFHLYRVLIAILDAKKMLAGCVALAPDTAVLSQQGRMPLEWNEMQWQQAQFLYRELEKVDDTQDYPHLVKAYQQVGRSIRWKMRSHSLHGDTSIDIAYQN
jgi:hypothetical protein